ncbi:hypothetical protein AQUCO_01300775v1 [Aquilegia coerulea]|nr:hypothetical protein AQUCO_01300775v1 [Aquilegia coerulea]
MHRSPANKTLCHFFVDLLTKEGFVLDLPDLHEGTALLFSRQGWLLVLESHNVGPGHGDVPKASIALLHPETDAKIIMPPAPKEETVEQFFGCFSFADDDCTPHLVVLAKLVETKLTLYVADVVDKEWIEHSCANQIRGNITVLVIGMKVYCLDTSGRLFIFNITTLQWTEFPGNAKQLDSDRAHHWMMESEEGEIMKIEQSSDMTKLSLSKLDESQSSWKRLGISAFMGRSWFVGSSVGHDNHFVVKEAAKITKIHRLSSFCQASSSGCYMGTDINILDLIKGSVIGAELVGDGQWVDLGRFRNLPPSIMCYLPPSQS